METLPKLQRIFRELYDDEGLQLHPGLRLEELPDWDSVMQVKMVLTVEAEFGFRFETEEVSAIRGVADLLQLIAKHQGATA